MREHAGLARARAREHQTVLGGRGHRLALGLVERGDEGDDSGIGFGQLHAQGIVSTVAASAGRRMSLSRDHRGGRNTAAKRIATPK